MEDENSVNEILDLIVHPVRLQILQVLSRGPQTTQEISDLVPNVPVSSLYRHLRKLLKGEVISVSETHNVNGIEEKVYELNRNPHITLEEMSDLSPEDHLRHFTSFVSSQISGFAEILKSPKFQVARMGYSEFVGYLSDEEMGELGKKLNQLFAEAAQNQPAEDRQRQKFTFISYQVPRKEKKNEHDH